MWSRHPHWRQFLRGQRWAQETQRRSRSHQMQSLRKWLRGYFRLLVGQATSGYLQLNCGAERSHWFSWPKHEHCRGVRPIWRRKIVYSTHLRHYHLKQYVWWQCVRQAWHSSFDWAYKWTEDRWQSVPWEWPSSCLQRDVEFSILQTFLEELKDASILSSWHWNWLMHWRIQLVRYVQPRKLWDWHASSIRCPIYSKLLQRVDLLVCHCWLDSIVTAIWYWWCWRKGKTSPIFHNVVKRSDLW